MCEDGETKVTDSRYLPDANIIRRRRECMHCSFRFSTMEEVTILDLIIVKRNGKREPYSREKLKSGLLRSLEKRSHTTEDYRKLISSVEAEIQKTRKNEVTSEMIGQIVIDKLKNFDKVAYIRFSSVYYSYSDISEFIDELSKLKTKKTKKSSN
ncbi:transcriptional regulator NrdR [Patescibacteria group bacterium]|nr:transcriptional regulator NrdR [Patescibacteria group bacterium]